MSPCVALGDYSHAASEEALWGMAKSQSSLDKVRARIPSVDSGRPRPPAVGWGRRGGAGRRVQARLAVVRSLEHPAKLELGMNGSESRCLDTSRVTGRSRAGIQNSERKQGVKPKKQTGLAEARLSATRRFSCPCREVGTRQLPADCSQAPLQLSHQFPDASYLFLMETLAPTCAGALNLQLKLGGGALGMEDLGSEEHRGPGFLGPTCFRSPLDRISLVLVVPCALETGPRG